MKANRRKPGQWNHSIDMVYSEIDRLERQFPDHPAIPELKALARMLREARGYLTGHPGKVIFFDEL